MCLIVKVEIVRSDFKNFIYVLDKCLLEERWILGLFQMNYIISQKLLLEIKSS